MNHGLSTNGPLVRQALPFIVAAPFAVRGLMNAGLHGQSLAETALLAALTALICALPPVSDTLRRGSAAHSVIFGLFLGVAIYAHVGRSSTRTFPFVAWRMFVGGGAPAAAHHLEIEGVRADGTRRRVAGEALFPTLRYHRFYMMVSTWSSRANASEHDRKIYLQILAAIKNAHNRANPEDPIDRVEVTAVERLIGPQGEPAP